MTSTDSFSGLRVAITGGTSGLGLALVRELVDRGARVAFVARTRERVEEVARENPGAHGIVGDVSVKEDIYPIAIQITGELGARRAYQQRFRSRSNAAADALGYRVRRSRTGVRDQCVWSVPVDESTHGRAGRVCT